jgi:hypothetical protein
MDESRMTTALALLFLQGFLGAFDTLYYHEFKLRLPYTSTAQKELILHASRDFVYALIFSPLAWIAFNGLCVWIIVAVLLVEIIITLCDFIQEDKSRRVPAGERVMHALMGIVYGAFLAFLMPQITTWPRMPTGFVQQSYGWMSWLLTLMSAGTLLSGVCDM